MEKPSFGFARDDPLSKTELKWLSNTELGCIVKRFPQLANESVLKIYARLDLVKWMPLRDSRLKTKRFLRGKEQWVYSGQVDGHLILHGTGTLVKANGSVYEGFFMEGRYWGHGRLIKSSGVVYEGRWEEGKLVGHAAIYHKIQLRVYMGDHHDKTPHGEGEEHCGGKHVYKGSFKRGLKHGMGEIFWESGNWYKG